MQAWKRDHPGAALHGEALVALYDSWARSLFPPATFGVTCLALLAGVFLEGASVSSPHAIICEQRLFPNAMLVQGLCWILPSGVMH